MAFPPGGPLKEAELVEVQQSTEQWSQYLLADGGVLRLKIVVTEVWRVIGEFDTDGNPAYMVKSSNIMAINAPDEIRRPEST
jgi:hypothetical protein